MKTLIVVTIFLATVLTASAQKIIYEGGSCFNTGFARVESLVQADPGNSSLWKREQYYIDTSGKRVFDQIISGQFYTPEELKSYFPTTAGDSGLLPEGIVMIQKESKFGVLTGDGKWLLQPLYDSIGTESREDWTIKKGSKVSIFTTHGMQLPFRFDEVYSLDGNYFQVVNNGLWGIYDHQNDSLVVPCIYQNMDYCYGCEAKGTYTFAQLKGKWGVINFQNKILIPFEYDHQHTNMRSDEWVNCLFKNGKQLSINLNTKQTGPYVDSEWQEPDTTILAAGFMRVKKKDKYGLLNPEGKLILDYKYDFIQYDSNMLELYFPSPYVAITLNNLEGVADTTGKILVPPKYSSVSSFADSFFVCQQAQTGGENTSSKNILLDQKGKKLLPDSYDAIELECNRRTNDSYGISYFKLTKNNHFGFYNPKTKVYVKPQYDKINPYGFATDIANSIEVKLNGHIGVVYPATGVEIMPPLFEYINHRDLPDGFLIVATDEQYGLYNYKKRKLIVPLKYDNISAISSQILKVSKGEQYGLVNLKGEVKIEPTYSLISALSDSFFLLKPKVNDDYKYVFYNSTSDKIISPPYDSIIEVRSDTLAVIAENGVQKLWNPLTGKITTGEYSKGSFPATISFFKDDRAFIYKDKLVGVIDSKGNMIIPAKYMGMSAFFNGIALVIGGTDSSGHWLYGYIDSTGKALVPPIYYFDDHKEGSDYISDSSLLLCQYGYRNSKSTIGLARRDGTIYIPPVYDKIVPGGEYSCYMVKKDKKLGILDQDGKVVLPLEFDTIVLDVATLYETHTAFSFPVMAEKNGYWQYYNRHGVALPVTIKNNIPFNNSVTSFVIPAAPVQ